MKANEACRVSRENSSTKRDYDAIMKVISYLSTQGRTEYTIGQHIYGNNDRHIGFFWLSETVSKMLKEDGYKIDYYTTYYDRDEETVVPLKGFFNELLKRTKTVTTTIKEEHASKQIVIRWCCEEDK